MNSVLSPLFSWRSAICDSETSPTARHVALTLSLHMNERGDSCMPTLEQLRDETGRGKSTIVTAIQELEQAGFLDVERPANHGGRGHINRYRAVVTAEQMKRFLAARPALQNGAERVPEPTLSEERVLRAEIKSPTVGPKDVSTKDVSTKTIKAGELSKANVQTVYDYWRAARHKTRASYDRISDGRRTKIQARLREFTVAELEQAVDGVGRDPWPDRPRHDDITVIFRNHEQVEYFIEMQPTNGVLRYGRGMTTAQILATIEEGT